MFCFRAIFYAKQNIVASFRQYFTDLSNVQMKFPNHVILCYMLSYIVITLKLSILSKLGKHIDSFLTTLLSPQIKTQVKDQLGFCERSDCFVASPTFGSQASSFSPSSPLLLKWIEEILHMFPNLSFFGLGLFIFILMNCSELSFWLL